MGRHFTFGNDLKMNASKLSWQQEYGGAPLAVTYHPGKLSVLKFSLTLHSSPDSNFQGILVIDFSSQQGVENK